MQEVTCCVTCCVTCPVRSRITCVVPTRRPTVTACPCRWTIIHAAGGGVRQLLLLLLLFLLLPASCHLPTHRGNSCGTECVCACVRVCVSELPSFPRLVTQIATPPGARVPSFLYQRRTQTLAKIVPVIARSLAGINVSGHRLVTLRLVSCVSTLRDPRPYQRPSYACLAASPTLSSFSLSNRSPTSLGAPSPHPSLVAPHPPTPSLHQRHRQHCQHRQHRQHAQAAPYRRISALGTTALALAHTPACIAAVA